MKSKRFLKHPRTTYYLRNNSFFVFRKCDEACLRRGSFLPIYTETTTFFCDDQYKQVSLGPYTVSER